MDYKELYVQFMTKLGAVSGDEKKPLNLKLVTIIVIIFLFFYGGYVYLMFKYRSESAYSNLKRFELQEKLKLMDTRLHVNEEE